jgi:hypothetical protein
MIVCINPSECTFITNAPDYRNVSVGADELLELQKTNLDNSNVLLSRILLKFKQPTFNAPEQSKYTILLRGLERREVIREFDVDCFSISSSWIAGTGKKYFDYPRPGATWESRDETSQWETAGGDYISSSLCSAAFPMESRDLEVDVTNIFSGSFPPNGVLLKVSDEDSAFDYGLNFFFSNQTKTIYNPELRISWDDSVYVTGSLQVLDISSGKHSVYINNMKSAYQTHETPRLNVLCRDKYVSKTFQSWPTRTYPHNDYSNYKALPSSSYYRVTDKFTNEIIIDFSDYTKISCDPSGSFFILNLTPFSENRKYKISVMVRENELVYIYEIGEEFAIANTK